MKLILLLLFCTLASLFAKAQRPRSVHFSTMGNDSINLSLNNNYNLIEDSCATVIRYGHCNIRARKFFGDFKDLSKQNPALILSKGKYSPNGLKDGEFTSWYPNGTLHSKGTYKNNKFDGKWEVYYESGKPEITFMADTGNVKILDMWNDKGIKTVDNGKGTYSATTSEAVTWHGKLNNGSPDGSWSAERGDNTIATENFKHGEFQTGKAFGMEYNNTSRIALISPSMFPYLNAERFIIAVTGCDGVPLFKIPKSAQFYDGTVNFNESISELIQPFLSKADLKTYRINELNFICVIKKDGLIGDVKCTTQFSDEVIRGLTILLRRLPTFKPATIDNKPVTQNLSITFTFQDGLYSFSYRLLPLKMDQ